MRKLLLALLFMAGAPSVTKAAQPPVASQPSGLPSTAAELLEKMDGTWWFLEGDPVLGRSFDVSAKTSGKVEGEFEGADGDPRKLSFEIAPEPGEARRFKFTPPKGPLSRPFVLTGMVHSGRYLELQVEGKSRERSATYVWRLNCHRVLKDRDEAQFLPLKTRLKNKAFYAESDRERFSFISHEDEEEGSWEIYYERYRQLVTHVDCDDRTIPWYGDELIEFVDGGDFLVIGTTVFACFNKLGIIELQLDDQGDLHWRQPNRLLDRVFSPRFKQEHKNPDCKEFNG